MADELTQAAKDEIARAIGIVREDRLDKLLRQRLSTIPSPAPEGPPPPSVSPSPPSVPPVVPPPPNNPPNPPNPDPNDLPPDREYSRYWGEILR